MLLAMLAHHRPGLVGRAQERHALDRLLDSARGGHSAALVLRGPAGVGKTALLDACVTRAGDFRVVRVACVESEMELPFAALHQLCGPMLDHLERLPVPQQEALRVAFGLAFGGPPDRFRVALAVLGLAAEVASERPLLCVVDDAQWLDAASALILGFVARRLVAESMAMVFAAREAPDSDELAGLPELPIGGLPPADAKALLDATMLGPIDEWVRDRLIAETQGNPLALLELAPGTVEASMQLGLPHELSGRIEQSFLRRLEGLDAGARRLLLLAASDPVGDPMLISRAARRLGIEWTGVPTEAEGLLTIGQRVAFRHPLVRSAVYGSASPDERREAHLALAHVTDAPGDADRRAWHLAGAAHGPDEEAASELERSADRARARGGYAAAAAFLQRAVALSQDTSRRTSRALAAARSSLQAGAFEAAREALTAAENGVPDEVQRAHIDLLRGQIAFAAGSCADAVGLLRKAARRFEPLDPTVARETYLSAYGAAIFAGSTRAQDVVEIGRSVRALPPPADPRATDLLLDGLAVLVTDGRAEAAPTLLRAVALFASDDVPGEESLRWGWMATAASNALWDDAGLHAVCDRHIRLARDSGALEQLPVYLIAHATAAARNGDLAGASSFVTEMDAVVETTRTRLAPFAAELLVAAFGGRESRLHELKLGAVQQALTSGQALPEAVAHWAEAVLHNGLGGYAQAVDAARRAVATPGDLYTAMWTLPELVEAATRTGEAKLATDAFERLVETTRAAGTDFGLGIESRCRALLADGDDAEPHYAEAIERLGRTRVRSELARSHLLYGEWLRRAGRRRDAREQLGLAHEAFVAMDMAGFAERTRRELVATGDKVRRRPAETRDQLTAQEAQIAGLAADGLSNPEIAARLFLSPRTIEWHLKKVFMKLGIKSRRQLRDVLPAKD